MPEGYVAVNVRMSEAMVARIDAVSGHLSAAPELIGSAGTVTRSNILRVLVGRALAQVEAEVAALNDPLGVDA